MTDLIKKIMPQDIEDISTCIALYRPGTQLLIPQYLLNKKHKENLETIDKDILAYTRNTCGIIIYQEQLMDIIRFFTNYSYSKADIFRRIISKKKYEQLAKLKEDFVQDVVKNNYDKDKATVLYAHIEEFAQYSFNHSHSIAYAYIVYWMSYLKVNYPVEFFISILKKINGGKSEIKKIQNEMNKYKINFTQPSLNNSNVDFSIYQNNVIFGFSNISGITRNLGEKIIETRNSMKNKKFNNYMDAIVKFYENGLDISLVVILINSGCFDELLIDKTRGYLISNIKEIYNSISTLDNNGNFIIKPRLVENNDTDYETQ
jgi:DNA polymerase-3 subunit alpha